MNTRIWLWIRVAACLGVASMSFSSSPVVADSRDEERRQEARESLMQLDVNRNGLLEPQEWKQSVLAVRFVGRLAERAGLDDDKPLPLESLVAARTSDRSSERSSERASERSSERSSERDKSSRSTEGGASSNGGAAASGGASSVPGFQVAQAAPATVGGFGTPANGGEASRGSGASRSGANSSSGANGSSSGSTKSSASSGDAGELSRYKEHAEKFIKMYDKDKDGMLKKNAGEWSELKERYQTADANKDAVLTTEELALAFLAFAKGDRREGSSSGSSGGSSSSGASSNSGSSSGSNSSSGSRSGSSSGSSGSSSGGSRSSRSSSGKNAASAGLKSYRQLSPTERLPKGLPDWFLRNDADADGQIGMSEYSAVWNQAKAVEFTSFDLDRDGFITAKECLKKLEAK